MRDRKENGKSPTSRRLFITRPTGRISCNRNGLDRIFFRSAGAVQSQAMTPPVFQTLNLLLGTCILLPGACPRPGSGTGAAADGGASLLGLRALVSRLGSAISQRTIMNSAG
jgi:hypothetical protein